MAGLWRYGDKAPEGKYLVQRRDGSIPEWPHFVIGAADPAAPLALRAYAVAAHANGFDIGYVRDVQRLADEFEQWRKDNRTGDPDAPPHRKDDPATVAKMASGASA